jgi:hypothetical protein
MPTPAGPGLVENRFGQGRSIYCSGWIFGAYLHSGIPTLKKLLARWLIAEERENRRLLTLDAPNCIEMTAYAQPERERILVHLVNLQLASGRQGLLRGHARVVEDVLPVHDTTLRTRFASRDIISATLQPAGRELTLREENGRAVIDIPVLQIHDIVEIRLRPGLCPQYPTSDGPRGFERLDLRAKIRQYLATDPPDYDPSDNGTVCFHNWPTENDATDTGAAEWDGLGAMQAGN